MNNKKPKLSKNNIATAKRLLKYVTETYKARFILVFICIFLSAVASIAVSLSLKYMLDDFILPLIGQKSPNYTEFYRALAVLGCIFSRRRHRNIYLYPYDGLYRPGRIKTRA